MVVAQVIGRGAPELTRFWGEPPLVREPDVTLFGYERLDQPEEAYLLSSPLRRHSALEVSAAGGANAARSALERIAGGHHEFVLHFDVDVISSQDFAATNFPAEGGLTWNQTREALSVFARQPTLAAMEVAAFNPELDPDGNAARKLVDLISEVLASRLVVEPPPAETEPVLDSATAAPPSSEHKPMSA
jgi:arginase